MLDIQVEDADTYTVCRPVGELDAYTVGQFRDALGELADADGTRDVQRTLEQAVCRLLSA